MLVKCMFSGSGGQGSALMAKLVCEGAMRENLKVVMTQTYGIEQRGGDSTAFIIISDEAIGSPIVENDATIAGALILGDRMSGKEYLGCVLMLAAVVLAQLPDFRSKQAAEK